MRASGGIRTPDQLITNQLLWPTELHWQFCGERRIRTSEVERQQIYSLPHLAALESPLAKNQLTLLRASGGIRTPDQLITNQLLWPTELHWQVGKLTASHRSTIYPCCRQALGGSTGAGRAGLTRIADAKVGIIVLCPNNIGSFFQDF